MSLLSKLGRQTLRIGTSDACEIAISGEGVAPIHAEIIHRGGGRLSFIPTSAGTSSLEGRVLKPGVEVPFDFRSPFYLGSVPLPLTHPALCLMVMGRGEQPLLGQELLVGRDPERCHLILNSPGVSGRHVTLHLEAQASVTDHHSTSGTWLNGQRLPSEKQQPLSDDSVLSVGPLPLPVQLARELLRELKEQKAPRGQAATEAMPRRTAQNRAILRPLSRPAKHRTVMGTVKMVGTKSHTIGRTSENDIVLDYAQISSRHARLTTIAGQVFIEDLASEHGTSVRGTRLKSGQKARVDDGDRILLGPMPAILTIADDRVNVVVEDQEGWAGRPLFTVLAANVSVEVADRDDSSKKKILLDRVSFKVLPGDFVALMGPSGSGKTTLLHTLTGYRAPSSGEVRVNDRPLSEVFETLRGSIGYVPQDDIIHPELTVFEAVRYSARFRLPSDYSEDEISRRVQTTLAGLGLEAVAHLQIGRPEEKVLSGGQRKRVNIAMELVTDPVLLFLDEPTSGLAADDTTALVALLARLAAEDGKTIIATIHQPARDEYEKFNLALILGHGGIPLYFGATGDAYSFFESWRGPHEMRGIDTPRGLFAELNERETRLSRREEQRSKSRQEVRVAVAEAYRRDYEESDIAQAVIASERGVGPRADVPAPVQNRVHPKGQLFLLLSRYLKIKSRDKVGTAILMLQAPLIGILLSLVFAKMKPAVPYWCLGALSELAKKHGRLFDAGSDAMSRLEPTSDHAGALFFLVVAAVWFGTSNAAREIVSERAIFRRERMVNLAVTNYVLSKFLILALLCVVQCATLLAIVFPSLGLAGGGSAFLGSLGILSLTAISSVALGLALSTVVKSSEAAMALTPIALIPQVVLGGLMVPVTTNALLKIPMLAMPSRWGFEGVVKTERYAVAEQSGWRIPLENATDSLPDFIRGGSFECALAQMESSQLTGAWALGSPQWLPVVALTLMTAGSLGLVVLLLKRRD